MKTNTTSTPDVSKYIATIDALNEDVKNLREKIRFLEMKLFGPKSEKFASLANDHQGSLFILDDEEAVPDENEGEAETAKSSDRPRKPSTGRKPLPAHLPRIDKVVDLDPEEKVCCGKEMACIGNDIREVLECLPAFFYVVRYTVPKYTCNLCHGVEGCHGTIATAELPARVLPGSSAGNSVVAEVVINKMADGLPGYRQSKRFERFGLTMSRRTVTNWLLGVAKKCHVLDKLLLESALMSGVIQMDETFFQVMGEEGRKNQTQSYMWVINAVHPRSPVIYFAYHPTRASSVPRALLRNYRGYVQTDGYKGYDFLGKDEHISLAACWAHVRRKFSDAVKTSKKKTKRAGKLTYAEEVLAIIRDLYAVEKRARDQDLSPDEVTSLRRVEAKPILEKLRASLDSHAGQFPEQSLVSKAIAYTRHLWPRLVLYIDAGSLPMDNNLVENVIRPFVVGRKNWLFAGSPEGAEAMATMYSLVETAKANGWEPYSYLRFLFDHLPNAVGEDELRKLLPNIATPIPTSVYVGEDQKLLEFLSSEPV